MNDAEHTVGANFKGSPSRAASQPNGIESKLVVAFIVVAVAVIGALVYWAM